MQFPAVPMRRNSSGGETVLWNLCVSVILAASVAHRTAVA